MITYNYDEWEKNIRPCDLILFTSNDYSSKCIRFFQNKHLGNHTSLWTHAGVVCPQHFIDFQNKDHNETYVLESLVSGFDGINNVETNALHNGLQIRNLKKIVLSTVENGGTVGCFRLRKPVFNYSIQEEKLMSNIDLQAYVASHEYTYILRNYWNEFKNTKYDFCNVSRAAGFVIPCLASNDKRKRLFCSEAVLTLYQHMGLVDEFIDAELISPEELGLWCGDVRGNSPFEKEPFIIQTKNTGDVKNDE